MKIQCDVCEIKQATVFCSADEASLCHLCDRRIHTANMLAGKHLRFSLIPPSPADSPLCDICQERRAFLFCKEDRAILCRECDVPIHRASEHTQRHNRFLLTGVKVSSSPAAYQNSSDACGQATSPTASRPVACSNSKDVGGCGRSPPSSSATTSYQAPCHNKNNQYYQMGSDQEGSISTSDYNVADYYTTSSEFMGVGPPASWHMDDLFNSPSASHFFGSKTTDYGLPSGAHQAESKYGYQYQ